MRKFDYTYEYTGANRHLRRGVGFTIIGIFAVLCVIACVLNFIDFLK